MKPRARHEDVLSEQVGSEWVLYDRQRHVAHRLNATAAWVWQHADGKRSISELTGLLCGDRGIPADPDLVRSAIGQLAGASLLEADAPEPSPALAVPETMSRREVAAALIPVVVSLALPSPADAMTSREFASPTSPTTNTNYAFSFNDTVTKTSDSPPCTYFITHVCTAQSGHNPDYSGFKIKFTGANKDREYNGNLKSDGTFTATGRFVVLGNVTVDGTISGQITPSGVLVAVETFKVVSGACTSSSIDFKHNGTKF